MTGRHAWTGRERRRVERAVADEVVRYLLAEHDERGWGTARVIDRSAAGAALLLAGPPWPRYRSEWRLLVDFGDGASPDHRGRIAFVRNTTLTEDGRIRIGVEFVPEPARSGLLL